MPPPTITKAQASQNSITLEWTLSDNPDSLQVQVVPQGGTGFALFDNISPTHKTYTFSTLGAGGFPLQPGETYECNVCSVYARPGTRLCSSGVPVTMPGGGGGGAPEIHITGVQAYPKHLRMVGSFWAVTDNGINISWVSSVPVIGLNVELDSTSGNFVKAENFGGLTGPVSYTHLTLPTNREV